MPDGQPISRMYELKISSLKRTFQSHPTEAEKHFEKEIAAVIADEARATFVKQRIFYITDQVGFIADFYFQKFKTVVEIDGSHHGEIAERDQWRSGLLKDHGGISVLRFSNKEILTNTSGVFNQVVRFLGEQEKATPSHRKYLRQVYSHFFDA